MGYAAVWYDGTARTEFPLGDGWVERIEPGAFDAIIRNGDDVLALFNHDMNNVLGRRSAGTMSIKEDKIGLRYTIDPPDTDFGRRVVESIRRGDVPDSSFGFIPAEIGFERDGDRDVRVIKRVDRLVDIGPVTLGAYSGTTAESRASKVRISKRMLRSMRNINKG